MIGWDSLIQLVVGQTPLYLKPVMNSKKSGVWPTSQLPRKGWSPYNGQESCPQCVHCSEVSLYYVLYWFKWSLPLHLMIHLLPFLWNPNVEVIFVTQVSNFTFVIQYLVLFTPWSYLWWIGYWVISWWCSSLYNEWRKLNHEVVQLVLYYIILTSDVGKFFVFVNHFYSDKRNLHYKL